MPDLIDRVWDVVVGHEGDKLDLTRADRGNWTGGDVGVGILRGSKFGISAKRYPDIDIPNLTYAAAKAIFVRDYWLKFGCDKLPPIIGVLVVDGAYNGGHPIQWLQYAVGVTPDGDWGPVSAKALADKLATGASLVVAEFMARRLAYLTALDDWTVFGARDGEPQGWARRICLLPLQALEIGSVR